MGVYGWPDGGIQGFLVQLFRALAESGALLVGGISRQGLGQQVQLVRLVDVPSPADAQAGIIVNFQRKLRTLSLFCILGIALERGREVTPGVRQLDPAGNLRRADLGLAPCQAAIIEGHQLLEDLQVLLGVVGLRQQAAQHDGPHQDQRLAALPVRAQRRQRLPRPRLALPLRLERDLLRREHGLDQRRCVPEGEGSQWDATGGVGGQRRLFGGFLRHREISTFGIFQVDSAEGGGERRNRGDSWPSQNFRVTLGPVPCFFRPGTDARKRARAALS